MLRLQFAALASAKSTTCGSVRRARAFVCSDPCRKSVTFARVRPWAEGGDVSSASLRALEEAGGFLGQPSLCRFEGPGGAEKARLRTLTQRPRRCAAPRPPRCFGCSEQRSAQAPARGAGKY